MFSRLAGLAVEPDATVAGCFGWGGVRMLFLSYEKKIIRFLMCLLRGHEEAGYHSDSDCLLFLYKFLISFI
jgi:hypothetical protein